MTFAAVDIGTNSIRLLVADTAGHELVRESIVTGLGRGVAASGRLSVEAIDRTATVLGGFRELMDHHAVETWRAVATSATRDAANRDELLAAAGDALDGRVEVIDGQTEALLAYRGATRDQGDEGTVVIDIGGGSTEMITSAGGVSVDIGSVRLTDLAMPSRPCPPTELTAGEELARQALVPVPRAGKQAVGVAGTWTSLAALELGEQKGVDNTVLTRETIDRWVQRLAAATLVETERLPGLDPARAPVILAGAVVAGATLDHLGLDRVTVSLHDLLDGVVAGLME